jgi:hypothetical protein
LKLLARLFAVVVPLASAAALGGLGAASTTACQTHQCDLTFVCIDVTGLAKFVDNPDECTPGVGGTLANPAPGWAPVGGGGYNTNVNVNGNTLTWTTSSLTGPWLNFPGNRTYVINLPPPLGGTPILPPVPFLSAEVPAEASDNFISGPAYLAEITVVNDQQLRVNNASCAQYSLLIEVQADLPVEAGASDASASSADADASPSDASAASPDAGSTE